MGKYLGVDHVALETNDMEATVRFYNDVLGMKLVRTLRTPDNRRHYFFDSGRGNYFAFFDGARLPGEGETQRLNHMSINIDSEQEFDGIYQRLKDHGVGVTDIIGRDYGRTFYFPDPNGIRLQIELQTEHTDWNLEGDPDPVPSVARIQAEA